MQGRGLLLAGVPGVAPAKVVILGGGVVGANAAKRGWQRAVRENPAIATGLNIANGRVFHGVLARQFKQPLVPFTELKSHD